MPGITRPVDDGDTISLGDLTGTVWRTEGHMDGHISFVFDGAVFCGDTLFTGGCGYLFDGPASTMFASLLRLASLPGDTLVCCAHEYTQDNLRFAWSVEPDNAALAERIRRVWAVRAPRGQRRAVHHRGGARDQPVPQAGIGVAAVRGGADAAATPAAVFAATRALKDTGAHREQGDDGLPL